MADMGLSKAEVAKQVASLRANEAAAQAKILKSKVSRGSQLPQSRWRTSTAAAC